MIKKLEFFINYHYPTNLERHIYFHNYSTLYMIRNQPKILNIYFLTEMCERFGFYVIQCMLIFYLINSLKLSEEVSYGILGSITALSYCNTVIGGYISDKIIGHKFSVLLASLMLSVGYGSLSALDNLNMIVLSLSFITVGIGLLVPSIRCMVSLLYNQDDVRRHSGFTFCYIGVNIGAIAGETISSVIQKNFGWDSAFIISSAILLLCFIIFSRGTNHFGIKNTIDKISGKRISLAFIIILINTIISYYVIKIQSFSIMFFSFIAFMCLVYIIYSSYKSSTLMRKRFVSFLILMFISTLYWSIYFQMFFSMNLFVDHSIEKNVFSVSIPTTFFPAIEALSVIFFGPVLVFAWQWIPYKYPKLNPTIFMKFLLALIIQCFAFGLLFLISFMKNEHELTNALLIVPTYLMIGIGELLFMPPGLSMIGELFPKNIIGFMLGIFLISIAFGGEIAGLIAGISTIQEGLLFGYLSINNTYQGRFLIYFIFSIVTVIIGLFFLPILKKLTNEKN